VKLKRFEEAIAHSKRAVALQPKEPEYRVTFGAALQYVGRLERSD